MSSSAYVAVILLGVLGLASGAAILTDWRGWAVRSYSRRIERANPDGVSFSATQGFERYRRRSGWTRVLLGVVVLVVGVAPLL